jgi:hypothetical protein
MKSIYLLLREPVSGVICLVPGHSRILEKGIHIDIRIVDANELQIVFDSSAVIERGCNLHFSRAFLSSNGTSGTKNYMPGRIYKKLCFSCLLLIVFSSHRLTLRYLESAFPFQEKSPHGEPIPSQGMEGLVEILDEVLGCLNAHRKPDQAVGDTEREPLFP